jgi:transcriptional regulator with XRE-family HTH domain
MDVLSDMAKRALFLSGREDAELVLFGRHVKRARLRRGLTQAEIAQRAGLARSTVVALEAGRSGVAIGAVAGVLAALGLHGKLAAVLEQDDLGEELDLSTVKRARRSSNVANF